MKKPPATTRRTGTVRCAIYTRKSSEEGLEQEFNSLQAQRKNLRRLREISAGSVSVVLMRRRGVALRLSGALSISVSSQLPATVMKSTRGNR